MNVKPAKEPAGVHGRQTLPALYAAFLFLFTNVSLMYLYPLALSGMGLTRARIGIVMGVFSFAAVISRPLLGLAVQKLGEGPILFPGLALATVAGLFYPFLDSFGTAMITVRVLHGIGFSAFITAGFSIAARTIAPGSRGEEFGFLGAAITAAVALAPPAGEALISAAGFNALYMAAVLALPASAAFCRISLRGSSPGRSESQLPLDVYRVVLAAPWFTALLVITWCFSHSQSTVMNFLALTAETAGTSGGKFFFAAFSTALITLLSAGRLVDRFSKVIILRLFLPVMALSLAGIPFLIASKYWAVAALSFGLSMGMLFPALNAMAAGSTPAFSAASMAVFTAVYDTGFITGPVISGWAADMAGLPSAFIVASLLVAGAFTVSTRAPKEG